MMVASSDMSHYIAAARARELDFKAIERMLQLDAEGLYRTVRDNRISMCGVAPAVIMLSAARAAGASRRRAGLLYQFRRGVGRHERSGRLRQPDRLLNA